MCRLFSPKFVFQEVQFDAKVKYDSRTIKQIKDPYSCSLLIGISLIFFHGFPVIGDFSVVVDLKLF